MTEAYLVRHIIAAIRARKPEAYVRKLSDRYTRGLPDILVVWHGRAIFLEIKTETGKLSKLQAREIEAIWQAGGLAHVVRSVESALSIFEESAPRVGVKGEK